MPYLIQRAEDGQVVQFWSAREGAVTIGRGTEDEGMVEDNELSRKHFAVVKDGIGYKIKDLGSTNGTFVNGQRITEKMLKPSDKIRAGKTNFDFMDGLTTIAAKIGDDVDQLKKAKPPTRTTASRISKSK